MLKKQNFPDFLVKKLASSDRTYKEGQGLFEAQNKVSRPYLASNDDSAVLLEVSDGKQYQVVINFYENGPAKSYQCTCEAFDKHDGVCRHVVASLFQLNQYEAEDIKPFNQAKSTAAPENQVSNQQKKANQRVVTKLLDYYRQERQSKLMSSGRQLLEVEFTLKIREPEWIGHNAVSLRMGQSRLYVVKDMGEVLEDLMAGRKIVFGKNFTYDPKEHRFSKEDWAFLEFLFQIQNILSSSYLDISGQLAKELQIPAHCLKEALRYLKSVDNGILDHQKFDSKRDYTGSSGLVEAADFNLYEKPENINLAFEVRQLEADQIGFFEKDNRLQEASFLADTDIMVLGRNFYFLDAGQFTLLKQLRDAFKEVEGDPLVFTKEDFSVFASEILSELNLLADLEFEEEVQSSLAPAALQSELYVDWQSDQLFVRPVFRYGDQTIYPLERSLDQAKDANDRLLIRNLAEEDQALANLLDETAGFQEVDYDLLTDDLEYVTHFIYHSLEELADDFTIYLTASAQNLIYQPDQAARISIDANQSANLLDISFEVEDIPEEDFQSIVKALAADRNYYKLSDGKLLSLKEKSLQNLSQQIHDLQLDLDEIQTEMTAPLFKGLAVLDNEGIQKGKEFKELVKGLLNPEKVDFDLPKKLNADLRSYQETGYKWLKTIKHYGFGAVLADDMGLGKTLQTIAFILSENESADKPFLVITPSSVLYNWQAEIEKFAPSLETAIIHGSREERQAEIKRAEAEKVPVWITSYPLIQRDADLYQDRTFNTLILDEAQHVKNMATKTSKAVKSLKAETVVALSGTPIENNLSELYSLFNIVQPGLFRSQHDFRKLETEDIAKRVKPFILRRLKRDVLEDLPEKTESIEYIELSPEQKQLYQAQLALIQNQVTDYVQAGQLGSNRIQVLAGMTRLRQICNDPRLIIEDYEGGSAKLSRLMEYLQMALSNGQRVVLFSQFTSMLDLIKEELDKEGWSYHYLDGQTPAQDRLDLTSRFNMGERNLFLISLKAGGTGLNLTGGDTVILYDSWWNPAVEDQAADRVHRFGQKKVVQVVRMISKGTIEERINDLQEQKRDLVDSVISTGESNIQSLSQEDILELLGIGEGDIDVD